MITLISIIPFLPELNAISRILDGELIFENRKLEFLYAYETFKNQFYLVMDSIIMLT